MADQKVTGAVAAIMNEREVAINLGQEKGVTLGMKFKVMERPLAVQDPTTRETLGTISREKIRVKVTEVQPKFCIARTYETYEATTGGLGSGFSDLIARFQSQGIVTRVRTFRQSDSPVNYNPLDPEQSFVKVGDPVELIEDEGKTS